MQCLWLISLTTDAKASKHYNKCYVNLEFHCGWRKKTPFPALCEYQTMFLLILLKESCASVYSVNNKVRPSPDL